jgi:4-amino-4-deoxy-L-arabinose transferase-like glycosyltransferase
METRTGTITVDMVRNKPNGAIVLLLVYAASAVFFLTVSGSAPFSDEAAYAKTAKILAEQNRLALSHVTSPVALVPIGFGALFLKVAGFSFTALRFSILIFSIFGALGFYWLLKELGLDESSALLGSLVLFAYPEFFWGSFLFMTDVPYVCLMVYALLFYLRGIARKNNSFLLLGSIFSFAACMTRQPGILIPFCLAVFVLVKRQKLSLVQWVLAVILPLAADLAGTSWFYRRLGQMEHHVISPPGIQVHLETVFYVVVYTGMLCLPLALGMGAKLAGDAEFRVRFGKAFLCWSAILIGILAFICWQTSAFVPFPYMLAPVVENFKGYGGTVYAYLLKEELPFELPLVALKMLFAISLVSAASLLSIFSITFATSPSAAWMISQLRRPRIRQMFFVAAAVLVLICIAGLLGREAAFAAARKMYNVQKHVHSFDENLPRIKGTYDGFFSEVGLAAVLLFAFQFLPRLKGENSLPEEAAISPLTAYPCNSCGLVYLVCISQAIFVIAVTSIASGFVFRRYILMFAPAVLLFVLTRRKNMQAPRFVAIGSMVVLVLYAALTTRGMMRFTEARWQGASYLLDKGVLPVDINAGLTFNNWYLDAPLDTSYDNPYLVISSPVPGYTLRKKISVSGGLSGPLDLYVLQRQKIEENNPSK